MWDSVSDKHELVWGQHVWQERVSVRQHVWQVKVSVEQHVWQWQQDQFLKFDSFGSGLHLLNMILRPIRASQWHFRLSTWTKLVILFLFYRTNPISWFEPIFKTFMCNMSYLLLFSLGCFIIHFKNVSLNNCSQQLKARINNIC